MKTTLGQDADEQSIVIAVGSSQLEGTLLVTDEAEGLVIFAHGGGSSLYSTRNRYIAHILNQVGLSTLLINLITHEEEAIDLRTQRFRSDLTLLKTRLIKVSAWLRHHPDTCELKLGYLGDDLAGGAALLAAAEHPPALSAIVLRSGQTNLAEAVIPLVQTPTLLIVGGDDLSTLAVNQQTFKQIQAEKQLEIIPRASHLFTEPGALEEVAQLASQWFRHYLTSTTPKMSDP